MEFSIEGGCTPENKSEKFKTWQESGQKVHMTGGEVNDAPALVQAIAMAVSKLAILLNSLRLRRK